MADNEHTEGETTEAPEAETTREPLQKEFEQRGESVMLNIVPVNDSPETPAKTLEVAFGHFKTWRGDEPPKVTGRYRVTYPRVVDGLEDHVIAFATDAGKAVAQVIKQSGRGDAGDYTFDLDDDFFKQKFTPPKEDENDVWASEKFRGIREELVDLRSDAETALEAAENAKENAQEEARALARVLVRVFDMVSGRRKALESWARGAEGAGNYPLLAKLGKGGNALNEAMRLAQIAEAQFDVLPATITSGKGIDLHRSRSIGALTADCTIKVEWPEDHKTGAGVRLPNIDGMAALMRRVASKGLGITGVDQMEFTQLGGAVSDHCARVAGEFKAFFGKSANTYNKDEYDEALRAYACVTISEGGESLFNSAVAAIEAAAEEQTSEQVIKALVDLYNGNILMKKAVDAAWAHNTAVEREQRNRETMKELENEDGPITKKAAVSFAKLAPLAAAAHLFKLLATHPDAPEVWSDMQSLVRQNELKKKSEPVPPAGDADDE